MSRLVRFRCVAIAAIAAVVVATACGETGDAEPTGGPVAGIRLAGFDFAESELLTELYAQAVEAGGLPVIRLGSIGPREIIAPAMELDRIDVVPEYLGTALQYAGGQETNPDPDASRTELNRLLAPRGLMALQPSPAEDKNVIVVTAEAAERLDLEAISDLVILAGILRFGGPAECPDRPLCLLGLETVYGLRFAEFVPQRSVAFTAEALRRSEIDVGLLFSTGPELEADDLVELIDDRRLQPAENIVPIVRTEALDRWGPHLTAALNAVSAHLTTSDLRALNSRVADGEAMADVASEWLTEHDLSGG